MESAEIKLYNFFRGQMKLADNEAQEAVEIIKDLRTETLATKEDLYRVKDELHKDIRSLMWMIIILMLPLYGLIV